MIDNLRGWAWKIPVCLFVVMMVAGCGSKKRSAEKRSAETKREKPVVKRKESKPESKSKSRYIKDTEHYIKVFNHIAREHMVKYGIPASITLAQGILESASGQSELTRKTYNHFGIKCHRQWTGPRVYYDDDRRNECFRKYRKPQESFADHSNFLRSRARYADLFKLRRDDYKAWARGLKKAGYATDRRYSQKLIYLIEKHKLFKYDNLVLGKKAIEFEPPKQETSNLVYIVKKGDTLYAISRSYNITVDQIKKENKLAGNLIKVGQKLNLTIPVSKQNNELRTQ